MNSTIYAYHTLPATNFSGYQKVSFWLKNSTAILANQWNLCLCSDTAGAVVVDTIPLPAIAATGQWFPLTIARVGGGKLSGGGNIQSIALYSGHISRTLLRDYIFLI